MRVCVCVVVCARVKLWRVMERRIELTSPLLLPLLLLLLLPQVPGGEGGRGDAVRDPHDDRVVRDEVDVLGGDRSEYVRHAQCHLHRARDRVRVRECGRRPRHPLQARRGACTAVRCCVERHGKTWKEKRPPRTTMHVETAAHRNPSRGVCIRVLFTTFCFRPRSFTMMCVTYA